MKQTVGDGLVQPVRDCISTQDMISVCSCAVGPGPSPVPALCWCQGQHRHPSWLDRSDSTFTCGNLRDTVLLKLGYLGCISNDIPTNKAIILTTAVSSGSLVISNAQCVRQGDVIWAPGNGVFLGQDFRLRVSANGDWSLGVLGSSAVEVFAEQLTIDWSHHESGKN